LIVSLQVKKAYLQEHFASYSVLYKTQKLDNSSVDLKKNQSSIIKFQKQSINPIVYIKNQLNLGAHICQVVGSWTK